MDIYIIGAEFYYVFLSSMFVCILVYIIKQLISRYRKK